MEESILLKMSSHKNLNKRWKVFSKRETHKHKRRRPEIRDVTSDWNLLNLMGMNLRPKQGLSRFILIGLMLTVCYSKIDRFLFDSFFHSRLTREILLRSFALQTRTKFFMNKVSNFSLSTSLRFFCLLIDFYGVGWAYTIFLFN